MKATVELAMLSILVGVLVLGAIVAAVLVFGCPA